MAGLERVAERLVPVERVGVAATLPTAGEVAALDQLADDPLGRSFGDADLAGQVPHPHVGVAVQQDENVRVVGQEGPLLGHELNRRSIR